MTIPADVARCNGIPIDVWHQFLPPCQDCQRRTDRPDHPRIAWMAPPPFVGGKCPERVGP